MHFIFEYIGWSTFVFLASGWFTHLWLMLAYITHIKKKRVGFTWYWRNRMPHIKRSVVLALVGGVIGYVYFYPPALDIETEAGRHSFAIYITVTFLTGSGSSLVFDIVRKFLKTQTSSGEPSYEVVENGETIFVSKEQRDRILNEQRKD